MPKIVTEQAKVSLRREIILAAAKEFSTIGFEQTRMEAIAKRAGIGKGSLYLHFSSKEVLFSSMLEEIAREQLQILLNALEGFSSLQKRIEILLATFNQLISEEPEAFQIFISSLYGVNRQFRSQAATARQPFLKLVETILKEAQVVGELKGEIKIKPAALLILNSCESLALTATALGFDNTYISQHQTQICQLLIAGLI